MANTTKKTQKKKQNAENLYRVTVGGEYFCQVQGRIETRPYKETATLNEKHKEAGLLSVMKNHYLPVVLKQKYPNFTALHTHELLDVVNSSKPDEPMDNPELMSLEQLVGYIRENDLPIEIQLYQDTDALRQAIMDYDNDPQAYLATQENRLELHGPTLEMKADLATLNPEVSGIDPNLEYDPNNVPSVTVSPDQTPVRPDETYIIDEETGEQIPYDEYNANNLKESDYDDSKPTNKTDTADKKPAKAEKKEALDGI